VYLRIDDLDRLTARFAKLNHARLAKEILRITNYEFFYLNLDYSICMCFHLSHACSAGFRISGFFTFGL
jgi:hypothetical protein